MAADLFESYAVMLVASLILGKVAFGDKGLVFPLIVPAIGVLTAIIGIFSVAPRRGDRSGMTAINRGFFISAIISAIGVAVACFTFLPAHFRSFTGVTDLSVRLYNGNPRWIALGAILIGIVLASAIQLLTGYFTETNRRPVKDIGQSSETGAATVILSGVSIGMESAVYSALLIAGAVFGSYLLATGNATIALFAVAMAGLGLLTTVGVIVSMDSFGPVTDNAQGIAEMSGDVEGDAAQALTTLDAIGNTTKAITKGIAIATAVLAATALFGSFRTQVESALTGKAAGTFNLDVAKPNILVGVIIGASIVFLFASLLISAVGRAAQRVVIEVRNQFRNHPGIMDYTEKPDYSRVVDIVTKDSLRELVTPGLLAVLAPIAVGFALGYQPLGSYLAGAIAVGVLMAVFLANSGGAWDNAKKLVEDGNHGGKGSEAHAATVVGDTVGDPFKDTAGPAINPLIKVMNLVSLLIATSVVKYSGNTGLRVGVAVGAVIIIVAAIVISKRRSHGMGEETPAGTEVTGAVSPAVEGATTPTPRPRRPRDHRRRGDRGPRTRRQAHRVRGRTAPVNRLNPGFHASPGFSAFQDYVVAGDAEQVQDRVQVGHAQRGVGRVPDHGLGVERHAEPSRGDHVQVVRAVAHRDRLGQRDPGLGGEPAQRVRLPRTVDDGAAQPPGQLARGDLELVGGHVVDAELGRQRLDHLDEAAADDAGLVAQAAQRPDQRARARGQPQPGPDLVQHPGRQPGQQRHPLPQ